MGVGRPKKPKEIVMVDMPLKVLPETAREIEEIANRLERSKSFINRKLLLRGLEAYRRDKILFDLEGEVVIKIAELGDDHPTVKTTSAKSKNKHH
jgi:hypothetical protein